LKKFSDFFVQSLFQKSYRNIEQNGQKSIDGTKNGTF